MRFKRGIWVLMAILGLQRCATEAPVRDNLLAGKVLVIGHGGAGFETYRNPFPANSLASAERALFADGADGIELDVQLSADGIPFLFHDATLERLSDCQGCIHGMMAEGIQKCRYETRNDGLNGIHPIPSLREALEMIREYGAHPYLFLNIKLHTPCDPENQTVYYENFSKALDSLISEFGLEEKCFVEALDAQFLLATRKVAPDLGLIFDDEDYEHGIAVVMEHDFEGLAISNNQVSDDQVVDAHNKGKWLGIWGVRVLSGTKRALEKAPEFIMTDDILMLRQQID